MALTLARQVSFTNVIVVLHCDYHRLSLRIKIFLYSE